MLPIPQIKIPEEQKRLWDEYFKAMAFASEIEAGIRHAERETGASLGDNRFVVETDNHKWSIFIRRINPIKSELEAELID